MVDLLKGQDVTVQPSGGDSTNPGPKINVAHSKDNNELVVSGPYGTFARTSEGTWTITLPMGTAN